MRDNEWLKDKLESIWRRYFVDVSYSDKVSIKFGRKSRTRLGSIKQTGALNYRSRLKAESFSLRSKNKNDSIITLTGYFIDERVPEYIIDLTIAHELCHYAHGFSSPLPQLFKYPHKGGVVDKELAKRGFAVQLRDQKKWLKTIWPQIIKVKKLNIKTKRYRHKVYKSNSIAQLIASFLDF